MGFLHKGKGKDKHKQDDSGGLVYGTVFPVVQLPASQYQSDPLDLAIAQVVSALEAQGLKYGPTRARTLLTGRFGHGDPDRALALALALRDAEDMIVVGPSSNYLLGSENLQGTTCYLDALLFAMYSRSYPIFDALLYHEGNEACTNRLVVNLRLFVNLLRSGYLITSDLIDMLRQSIAACGWADAASASQQDTSECFGFIAEMLQMPTLTFKVHIAHGGKADAGADNKIVQERFLALSVPQQSDGRPIELVDLIDAYFHTKLQVRRPIARSRSTMNGPASLLNSNGYPIEKKAKHQKEVSMDAWQLFELVPHYTASNNSAREQDFAQQPPVVAICLKRYYFDRSGTAQINRTPIIIPEFIDFTSFTDSAAEQRQRTRLILESAVCHRGQNVGSGHYVSIVRGAVPGQWLLFDDLARNRVTQSSFGKLFSVEVPYLLFYQLEVTRPRPPHPNRRQPSVPHFMQPSTNDIPFYSPETDIDPHASAANNESMPLPPYPLGDPGLLADRGFPPPVPEHTRPNRQSNQ